MILLKNWFSGFVFGFIFVFFFFFNPPYGEVSNLFSLNFFSKEIGFKGDTIVVKNKKSVLVTSEPDTNFTWEKYASFLTKISDTSKYIVLPINEFRMTLNPNKIVIGLRHDVDDDLEVAYKFSETESRLGFRSTYYILHTAPYYLADSNNMAVHSEKILPVLRSMQNDRKFEIGWHNDLVTLQAVYNIDPVSFFHNELAWLRSNGINIYGTSSHGSNYCYTYKYLNYYFFEEYTSPVVGQFVNNLTLPINGNVVPMKKGKLSDFNLEYEAYFINNNKYFSDASVTNGIRWNIGNLDLNKLQAGDRVIILLHPIHWHKASVAANIESFRIPGQRKSVIDSQKSTITVEMPYGSTVNSLMAVFSLSQGAYARVSGTMQVSGTTLNNYTAPLTYTVYAENRDIHRDWTVNLKVVKNSESNFESFIIPGFTKTASISSAYKTIYVEVDESTDIKHLPVKFEVSAGARVWIGNEEQFSNNGTINFSSRVEYKIIAEDGISSSIWTAYVLQKTLGVEKTESGEPGLVVYPNPSEGSIHLKFRDLMTLPTNLVIFNAQGEKVYSESISKSGNFTLDINLKKLQDGVYFIKYSNSEKPELLIIQKH